MKRSQFLAAIAAIFAAPFALLGKEKQQPDLTIHYTVDVEKIKDAIKKSQEEIARTIRIKSSDLQFISEKEGYRRKRI